MELWNYDVSVNWSKLYVDLQVVLTFVQVVVYTIDNRQQLIKGN